MKKTSVDLTQGNLLLLLIHLMVPIFLTQLCQNLYNSVDSIVVGRFVGTTALAAVTACGDISHIMVGFFSGLSIGAGVILSRYFGAGDQDNLQRAIHTTILIAVIMGFIMSAAGILLTPHILQMVKCPADVYAEASIYLRIYFIGVLFTSIYNVANGVLRAVGDTRSPLHYLFYASMTNIVLDFLFVRFFNFGVAGVAIATIFAQSLSVFLVFKKMVLSQDVYKLYFSKLHIDRHILLEVLYFGLPTAIQNCMITFSNLFVQRYTNVFGSAAMAGVGAAKKVDRYIGDIAKSLGMSTAVFSGQNIGAKRYDRVFRGIRCSLLLGLSSLAGFGGVIYAFSEQIIRIFTTDPNAVQYGVAMMHVILPLYFTLLVQQIFSNVLRSFGYSLLSMIAQLFGMVLCRQIYLKIAMIFRYDICQVYYSFPVGWAASALFSFMLFLVLIARKRQSLGQETISH